MTTPADIRSAWNTAVWTHASITALTTKIYAYDVTSDSAYNIDKFRFQQAINFFTYVVTYADQNTLVQGTRQRFTVTVSYFREADTTGAAFNAVVDNLYTVQARVRTGLGKTWSSTVDYYQPQETPIAPTLQQIDGKDVWRGTVSFDGFKSI